ncbi:hypothetical protein N0V88_007427, partial [Collariella sp. IMI 366227]
MAAVITATTNSSPHAGRTNMAPRRALSITTALNHGSPSSVSSPASAPSPGVSTPTSSCSTAGPPIAIRPSAANIGPAVNAMSSAQFAMSPASMPPGGLSMTTKEWVIPPRPKPGRKPATDTPPTKRKAQNRAAQRAFRERRAARVGELEEQIEEERVAHDRTVGELQERISHLELETQTLQSRCQWLEAMLEKERQDRSTMNWDGIQHHTQQIPAGSSQTMRPLQPGLSRTATANSVSIVQPRPMAQPFSIAQIVSPPEEPPKTLDLTCGGCQSSGSCVCADDALRDTDIPIGCGDCTLGSRCACLEETIRASIASDLKRPLPPSSPPPSAPDEKRQRSDAGIVMETDFTAMFSSQSNREPPQTMFQPPPQPQLQPMVSIEPRDSCGFCKDGGQPGLIKPTPPITKPPGGGCGPNGPGTCAQSGFGIGISCAEAYKTLASHRHFEEAADDIG